MSQISQTTAAAAEAYESYSVMFRRLPRAMVVAANNFVADGLFNQCAAISYYALLSVPAFVSLLASIMGFFLGSSEEGMEAAVDRISQLIPELPTEIVQFAAGFVQNSGAIGAAALVLSLWIAHLVFAATQTAVSYIFHLPPAATFDWRRFALRAVWAWLRPFLLFFAAASMLVLSFAFESIMSVLRSLDTPFTGRIVEFTDSSTSLALATSLVTGAIVFGLVMQALTPHMMSLRVLLPTSILGALLWELASQLFSSYLRFAASVRSFSGSAGAVVIFMLWVYYAATVLLYSLEVAAALSGNRTLNGSGRTTDPSHTL